MNEKLTITIEEISRQFAADIKAISDEPYINEAILKIAVRSIAWELLHEFGDKYTLSEQLNLMSELIKDHEDS